MVIPDRLHKGDRVGIVSPSSAITPKSKQRMEKGIGFLRGLGLEVELGRNALKSRGEFAGTPEEKGEDINSMFADKRIKAIFASQGGSGANTCLPYLDYAVMKENPKVFMGISDVTAILNAIHCKAGLVTFHGDDVTHGLGSPIRYVREEFVGRLMEGKIGAVKRNSRRKTVRKGVATGKLLGGNLGVFLELAGTPYLPDLSESVLFVESFKPTPEACYERFCQLEQMGVFGKVKGVVVGYIYGLQTSKRRVPQMEDILLEVAGKYDFPILKMNDFGHNCPNTVLPIGAEARVDATAKELEILEPCVN